MLISARMGSPGKMRPNRLLINNSKIVREEDKNYPYFCVVKH